jgi:uncharacterized protein YbjT (DUF2867 family)
MILNSETVITLIGGSGFVGRHIVRNLAQHGVRMRIAVRRPSEGIFLKTMGYPGQINVIQANVRFQDSLEKAIEGSDAVINLVGVLSSSGQQSFQALQADAPALIAKICAQQGIKRFLHMSALGADAKSESIYARTKAEGEERVLAAYPSATIFRPSVIFGLEDQFIQRLASLIRMTPVLPLFAQGKTPFSPVYVNDVALAFVQALLHPPTQGQTYTLGGEQIYTLKQIIEKICAAMKKERLLLPIPALATRLCGLLMQYLPAAPLTLDQAILLEKGSALQGGEQGFEALGIRPQSLDHVLPHLLMP